MSFAAELQVARRLAVEAGTLALSMQSQGLAVEHKSGDEPVTAADRAANTLVVDGLRAAFPDDFVLSEEAPDDEARIGAPRVWMVDPIDGTKDFIRGEGGFATMIGLVADGDLPVVGAVYQPRGRRLYYASRGDGAFVVENDSAPQRMAVSNIADLTALRMVASKSHRDERIDQVRSALGVTDEINVGSVGLKLGLIARGERDLYVNPAGYSKLWDVCGPEIILREAGGILSDARGAPLTFRARDLANRRGLIASNGHIHDAIVARLSSLFGAR